MKVSEGIGLVHRVEPMRSRPVPILHVITGLNTGGAEMMLYKLLAVHDAERFAPVVVVLADSGTIGPRIERLGIPVYPLHLMQDAHLVDPPELARKILRAGSRLAKLVDRLHPRLVQGWMYHGNLAATFASGLSLRGIPTVWNVRQSLYDISAEKPFTQIAVRANAALSFQPQKIIYNSTIAAQHHEQQGFAPAKSQIIPNGFDCDRFHPQADAHSWLCHELGLPQDSVLIGLIGRYHDMKDHRNLVEAARWLVPQVSNLHFVLAGREVTPENPLLQQQTSEAGVGRHFHLMGERTDVSRLMAGLDILASTSWTEAFPNVIGEAMASGVPCVVTDVGDSAAIVEKTGLVVPPRDPKGLAGALAALLASGSEYRKFLGQKARQRVLDTYALPQISCQYEALYTRLLA